MSETEGGSGRERKGEESEKTYAGETHSVLPYTI